MKTKTLLPFDLLLLLTLIALLFSKGLSDPTVSWPDADRILMDGICINDFLHDTTLSALFSPDIFQTAYHYALNYFAQYPALSLGNRPPFFPVIEALFFFLFGLHDWSGKLAVIVLALTGVIAWFDLVCRTHNRQTARIATGLLFTTPFIVNWGWVPMLEIPVLSITLITANLFWRYSESGKLSLLYLTGIFFSMALWTKQPAIFMLVWFVPWLLITGRMKPLLQRKSSWGAIGLTVILTLPLGLLSVWMGRMNVALTFHGADPALTGLGWSDWTYLRQYLDILVEKQLTLPVLLLGAAGAIGALWKKDRHALFYLLLIVATYFFFTALRSYRIDRYTIFWVPAFALFAALPFHYLQAFPKLYRYAWLPVVLIMAFQMQIIYEKKPPFTTGYQEAAQVAMAHSQQKIIFMDGVNNGYFTYFVRLNDIKREFHVMRGDKILHSSAIFADFWTEVHVKTLEGIKKNFDQYGIDIIVIEERNYTDLPIHQILRDYVKTDAFELIRTIPIDSIRSQLIGQNLFVYRYKEAKKPSIHEFSMSIPVVGMKFKLPFKTNNEEQAP